MFTPKLEHWLVQQKLPQRLLLSGSGDLVEVGLSITSQLLNEDLKMLSAGLNQDVKVCRDDQQSLKIGDSQNPHEMTVRGLIKWLYQTPVSSQRVLVLENIERTSRDAMQAWLKVLEEPPARAQFIITTQNHYQLPTTILSRATVLNINGAHHESYDTTDAETFLGTTDLITQFRIADDLDKQQKENPKATLHFMNDLLRLARCNQRYLGLVPQLFTAYTDIKRNVNRRLVLEHLAITLQNH